eukprot:ANDGO_02499.mRNA.1 Putative ubiquitin-conjugating enzyme E2 38
MSMELHPEDVVRIKSRDKVGIVTSLYSPFVSDEEQYYVPEGSVLVFPDQEVDPLVVPLGDIELIDRCLCPGDVAYRVGDQRGELGIVQDVRMYVDLVDPRSGEVLLNNVDTRHCSHITHLDYGAFVEHVSNGSVGRIQGLQHDVQVFFPQDASMVTVEDASPEMFSEIRDSRATVGSRVKFGEIGRELLAPENYVAGSFKEEHVDQWAVIVGKRLASAAVMWFSGPSFERNQEDPWEDVDPTDITMIPVFDPTEFQLSDYLKISRSLITEDAETVSDWGNLEKGQGRALRRSLDVYTIWWPFDTTGDVIVGRVCKIRCLCKVLWQSGVESEGYIPSIDLVSVQNVEDHDLFPFDIVLPTDKCEAIQSTMELSDEDLITHFMQRAVSSFQNYAGQPEMIPAVVRFYVERARTLLSNPDAEFDEDVQAAVLNSLLAVSGAAGDFSSSARVVLSVDVDRKMCKLGYVCKDGEEQVGIEDAEEVPVYDVQNHPLWEMRIGDAVFYAQDRKLGRVIKLRRDGFVSVVFQDGSEWDLRPSELVILGLGTDLEPENDEEEEDEDEYEDDSGEEEEGEEHQGEEEEKKLQAGISEESGDHGRIQDFSRTEDASAGLEVRVSTLSVTAGSANDAESAPSNPSSSSVAKDALSPVFHVLPRPAPSHKFIEESSSGMSARMLRRIQHEWNVLRTSILPSQGIHCFVYEERLDLMSFIIVGTPDTPYEDVPFMFDLQFSASYPNEPPRLQFVSLISSKLHPNLYTDGTVCLSLLGTWHSASTCESWSPAVSTILQLVVSLQSLLLVQEPYFLEAGYDRFQGTDIGRLRSREFNENAYLLSLRYYSQVAMSRPILQQGMSEVLAHHFGATASNVLTKARQKSEDPNISTGLQRVLRTSVVPLLENSLTPFLSLNETFSDP